MYGIYLIRKILGIKDTISANAQLILFFVYSFIVNSVAWLIVFYVVDKILTYLLPKNIYFIFTPEYDGCAFYTNILSPVISFLNLIFCSGFIITFTIGEFRPFYTYKRYFKELSFYFVYSFVCLVMIFILGLLLVWLTMNNDTFRTTWTVLINISSSYVILITMLSWTNFLKKDLYPEVDSEDIENLYNS